MKPKKTILKRQINPDNIAIIEHTDFNIAPDGENIFYIKVPNPLLSSKKTVKAFRAFGHVFIVPERYLFNNYYTKNLDTPKHARRGSIYDPSYLSTDHGKSDFLKKITLLLQRIEQTNTGQCLLKALWNGVPLKEFKSNYPQKLFDSFSTVQIVDEYGNPTNENLPCSLIIYGPTANCAENKTLWLINENNAELTKNGHGTMAEIIFNPDIFHAITTTDPFYSTCVSLRQTFVQDPAISLFHEMVHALHINYGSVMRESISMTQNNHNIAADELTIVSKSDKKKIPYTILERYDQRLKDNLDIIVNTLNSIKITSKKIETEIKTLYQNKYLLDYDPASNKYSWTKEKFDLLKGIIRYSIYEQNISKDLNVLVRKSYLDNINPAAFRANILDEKTYTIAKGFNIRGGYSGQKTDNPKLIKESSAVATLIKIFTPKHKRNTTDDRSYIEIDSDKIIPIVNDDYSDYQIIHTINDTPLDPEELNIKDNTLYFPKVDNTVKTPLPDTQVEKITVKSEGLITRYIFETNSITIPKTSLYHILKSQLYDKTLDPKKDKIQFINADGKDTTINSAIRDNKKIYSYFPKLNTTINTTQSFANFYTYAQWGRQLIKDFEEESTTKKIQKVGEDIIQIVPYLGAAYNVGNDISHKEFVQAFIDAGIGMLLLFFPETVIPVALYDITTKIIQSKNSNTADINNNLKKIENTLNNAFTTRETYLRSYTTEMLYMWWGHVYLQVEDMIYNISQQFENYKLSILHNITYHGLKILEKDTAINQQMLDILRDSLETDIDAAIEKAMQNTINMLSVSSKKYLKENWGDRIIKALKTYDNQVFSKLNIFIDNHAKGIPQYTIEAWKSKLIEAFDPPTNLGQILNDKEINKNIDKILYNFVIMQSEEQKSKILCEIDVIIDDENKSNKIIDITGQHEITVSKNINQMQTPQGRKGHCILFEKDRYIILEKNKPLSKISLLEDFTWNFWIRHPLEISDTNQKNDVTIIQFTEDKIIADQKRKLGFQFVLRNGNIYFIIRTLDDNDDIKYEFIGGGDIQDNKWHMITISFDSKNDGLYCYRDTFLQQRMDTAHIQKTRYNADLKIGFKNNNDPDFFFKIEQFKLYSTFFKPEEVQLLYHQDMSNYLYDHWGEPLRYNTPYYLNHIPLEGHETTIWTPLGYNTKYVVKGTSKYEFKTAPDSKCYPDFCREAQIEFYDLFGIYEQMKIMNRPLLKAKILTEDSVQYLYNQNKYLIAKNTPDDGSPNLLQLHALRNEIARTSDVFNPYSIIITGTTNQDYNDGAFIDYYDEGKYYYNLEGGDFKVDHSALTKPGKRPFIESMENEKDNYINRFCWTFVPKDQKGWKVF